MYQSLVHFLQTFSVQYPLPWALLVMVVIAATGLFLYAFWEVALRLVGRLFAGGSGAAGRRGH